MWNWRSAVANGAAALHPCSDAGISETLCYTGVSSVGEEHKLPRPFSAGEGKVWYMGERVRGLSAAASKPPWQTSQVCWSTAQLHPQPLMPLGFPLNEQGSKIPAAWLNVPQLSEMPVAYMWITSFSQMIFTSAIHIHCKISCKCMLWEIQSMPLCSCS